MKRDSRRGAIAIWVVVVVSLGSFRSRPMDSLWSEGGFDAQVFFEIGCWLALGSFALYLLLRRDVDFRPLRRGPLLWYGLFVAVAALSSIYSPVPRLTLFRAAQLGVALVFILAARLDRVLLYRGILLYVVLNLVLFAAAAVVPGMTWASPATAFGADRPFQLNSALGHPSVVGVIAAAGAAGLVARSQLRKLEGWELTAVVVLVAATLLTVNRTAIAGLCGAVFLVLLAGRRGWAVLGGLWICAGALVLETQTGLVTDFLRRGQSIAELQSLTGRLLVYDAALERIARAPILGEGFVAERKVTLGLAHAHNSFLQAALNLGVMGMLLFAGIALSWAGAHVRLARAGGPTVVFRGLETAAMSVPLVGFCVMDAGFVGPVSPVTFVYLGVFLLAQRRAAQPVGIGTPETVAGPGPPARRAAGQAPTAPRPGRSRPRTRRASAYSRPPSYSS